MKLTHAFVALLLVASAAAAANDASNALRIHSGSVIIKTKQYETMVIVRAGDDNGGAEHLFHMWAKPALSVDGSYCGAEIEFTGPSLILTFPTKKTMLTFTVGGHETSPAPVRDMFSMTGYTVMGLNHEIGAAAAKLTVHGGPTPYVACDTNCDEAGWEVPDPWDYGAGGGSSCYSGGFGSTSCSQSNAYGSCSVVCNGTTSYACCTNGTPPSCFCKGNQSP